MKKSCLPGVLGLAIAVTQSSGADVILMDDFRGGCIEMDNYNSHGQEGGPVVTYPAGFPANGISGPLGVPGSGLSSDWVAGIYYALGDINLGEPFGYGMPDPKLASATGSGNTAQFASIYTSYTPGEFYTPYGLYVGGNAGDLITAEVVVYPAASGSYANALYRMHSASFTMPTLPPTYPLFPMVGDYMPVFPVPEPGALALVSFGLAALLLGSYKKYYPGFVAVPPCGISRRTG